MRKELSIAIAANLEGIATDLSAMESKQRFLHSVTYNDPKMEIQIGDSSTSSSHRIAYVKVEEVKKPLQLVVKNDIAFLKAKARKKIRDIRKQLTELEKSL